MNDGQRFQEENWGGGNGHFQRGFNQYNNRNYNGNPQRWNNSGRGGYQQHFRNNGHTQTARSDIDVDLLQQTVHAVVVAVTAAQKSTYNVGGTAAPMAAGSDVLSGVPSKNGVVSAAAPAAIQEQVEVPNQIFIEANKT
jgi:hypothetical protein